MNATELLASLNTELAELPRHDEAKLDRLSRRAEMAIRTVFGPKTKYLKDLDQISFHPGVYPADDEYVSSSWTSGAAQMKNLLDTMLEEISLAQSINKDDPAISISTPLAPSNRVFIVHGKDEEMKQSVARVVEKLGIEAVILHEQPNQGRTIIEKFTEYATTPFAVVLLSGDDLAYERTEAPAKARPRARQNVVLELGYFLGKLGRDRVFSLFRPAASFEMPSDYSGVVFTPFDDAGRWQFDLVRELKAAGYAVDANRIL